MQEAIWVAFTARGLSAWQLAVQGQFALEAALKDGSLNASELSARNPEGWTALHVAAQAGNKMHVRALLSLGAEVDATNAAGRTPAFIAAWQGHLEVMVELSAAGADLNSYDDYGCSIAHRARQGPSKSKHKQRYQQDGQVRCEVPTPQNKSLHFATNVAFIVYRDLSIGAGGCNDGRHRCVSRCERVVSGARLDFVRAALPPRLPMLR